MPGGDYFFEKKSRGAVITCRLNVLTEMRCFWTRSLKSCPPKRLLPAIA